MTREKNIEEPTYYDGSKLINMKDLDHLSASIFIVCTNRSAGKTTFFLKYALERYRECGEELCLIYRYKYELSAGAELFTDILHIYPDLGKTVTSKSVAQGMIYILYLDDKKLGCCVALSNIDTLKKYSGMFVNIVNCIMDEFQTEKGKYLTNEVENLQSLLITIARGGGSQSRDIKVYLLGNMVTIMNPYFITFGIHKRLKPDTHFIRGHGWIAEVDFNQSAANAIKSSAIYRAFSDGEYMRYSTTDQFLIDAGVFVSKPKGRARYLFTIVYDGRNYGVREYWDEGILHISQKPDSSCKTVVAFKASDHTQNSIMLSHYDYLWKTIRNAYNGSYLRFDDIKTKSAIMDILAIDLYS